VIHFLTGTDLILMPKLAASMFRDRNAQFVQRLGWQLNVDQHGFERDQYDHLNPLYVIIENEDGLHDASLRLMPTTGPTMINEHFSAALDGQTICRSDTWECTRFCIAPGTDQSLSIELLAATGRLMRELHIKHLVAVYDRAMRVQYRRAQTLPEQLGMVESPEGIVYAGRWSFTPEKLRELRQRSKIYGASLELSLVNSPIISREKVPFD